ncbi:MAG TPA: PilZ domain-containing protein [Candidatus Goldiibacteriota bacterium]|nr:PilZ domain-containing protein [Candidatus Goldiibacteriota bacterium]
MPQGEIFLERRKFKRVNKRIKVSYKVVSLPAEIEEIKKKLEKNTVESVNISAGGIQLIDDEELAPEQILRIEINVGSTGDTIITFAEVRWCAKDNALGRYRTGIEFLVLKDEDKDIIDKIVEAD